MMMMMMMMMVMIMSQIASSRIAHVVGCSVTLCSGCCIVSDKTHACQEMTTRRVIMLVPKRFHAQQTLKVLQVEAHSFLTFCRKIALQSKRVSWMSQGYMKADLLWQSVSGETKELFLGWATLMLVAVAEGGHKPSHMSNGIFMRTRQKQKCTTLARNTAKTRYTPVK